MLARQHIQTEGDVLRHSHMPEQSVVLKHKAHTTLAHMTPGHILTVEQNSATVGTFKPGNDPQQGRFA